MALRHLFGGGMQALVSLPEWLVTGLLLGVLFSVVATAAFVAGTRLFPAPDTDRGSGVVADVRRREEVRGYLQYIGEPFAEDHAVAGQTVAFYLPERAVAVTFDARAYFRIEGTDVHPVLVEHELPGGALGARLPFETPDLNGPAGGAATGVTRDRSRPRGRTRAPAGGAPRVRHGSRDPTAAAFEVLGLAPTAGPEEVRTAYRERLKRVHPDQGGDRDAFRRLREAYTVAKAAAR